jgi:hypothetical protein
MVDFGSECVKEVETSGLGTVFLNCRSIRTSGVSAFGLNELYCYLFPMLPDIRKTFKFPRLYPLVLLIRIGLRR